MNFTISDSSSVIDREKISEDRLSGFSGTAWLRGRLEEEGSCASFNATIIHPDRRANLMFEPPQLSLPKVAKFISEQMFDGVVLSVDPNAKTFWARLVDRTNWHPEEEAEFAFDEVPEDDWFLVVPGALFSWNIGREYRDQQMRRVADFRFRRSFIFSKTVIESATERAVALAALIAESDAYLKDSSTES